MPSLRLAAFSVLCLTISGCMPTGRTFDATTTSDGHLKASDAASHSKARITREGRLVTIQGAYRFDLARLVDVDHDYQAPEITDEAQLTRDEAIVSTAVHGAFGLGIFDSALARLDTPWAQGIMSRTRVGRPLFVRSLSPKRDDYYVVPVFYRNRWAVSSHVGVSGAGLFYSNGFTIPNMPIEPAGTRTVYGRANLERLLELRQTAASSPSERVYVETIPAQNEQVLGYAWLVHTKDGTLLVDPSARTAHLTGEQESEIDAGHRLSTPITFRPE